MSISLSNPKFEDEGNGRILRSNTAKSQLRVVQMQRPGSLDRAPAPAGALGSISSTTEDVLGEAGSS